MFENILTKDSVSFKDLEEIAFKIACEFASEVSYRVCAEMISKMTGLTISGVGVWNIVQKLGEEIKQYEQEKVTAYQEDKLKAGKNRYALVGKEYVAGYMTGEEMSNITNANLHSKYDMSKVELRVLNSDGGSWIKKLVTAKSIYQADSYHLKEKISTHVRDIEDVEVLKNMFYKKEYSKMIEYVEGLKYKYDGEVEEVEKLKKLKRKK